MFSQGSRYVNAGTYTVTLPDGTPVIVTRIPLPGSAPPQGWHRCGQSERLDLLAYVHLGDATAAWRLGWCANAVVLDALAARELIPIPGAS
jgi:hypothetical protein